MAKMIIELICHIADMLNRDTTTHNIIKVVFMPNYRVSLAEKIFPAADISEQISTAGYEASGTSNMKFGINGALTIGTFDGATIEIAEEVGNENIFIMGLNADEVVALRPTYKPSDYYLKDPFLQKAIDLIRDGFFCYDQPTLFNPLIDQLLSNDPYLVLADFESYHQCQQKIDALYKDQETWTKKAILNVARMGRFSSDRTIMEYNQDIWNAQPLTITKEDTPSQTGKELDNRSDSVGS